MTTSKPLTFQEFKTLSVIVVVAICGMLGVDIHLASMPYIMKYLHTNKVHMQQSVSIFLLGMGVSLLFYGPLSDRFGRRPIVVFGLIVAALASFSSVFTKDINAFLITRLIQGLGAGVCTGLGRTIVADVLQGEKLAAIGSYFGMFTSLSPLLAPALGGYIQHWFDWQANFIFLGCFLTFALLLYLFICPETNKHKNPRACHVSTLYQNYKSLIFHPVFIGCTLLSGIAMAASMAYATTSSFIFQTQFGITPIVYGWLTAIAGAGSFIGKFFNPLFIRNIGSQKTLFIGLLLLLIAGLWMLGFIVSQFINVPLIMIAVFATLFAQPFIMATAVSKALSPFHDKRGAAGALYGSFQMLTAFLSSAIIGLLAHDGVIVLALSYIVLALLGIVTYRQTFKQRAEI